MRTGAILLQAETPLTGTLDSTRHRSTTWRSPRRETFARSSGSTATHLPRVHSLVRRMTAGRDADELTQDVFVRVWQKLASFRGDSAFGTWLHRLAVNVVIERFRTEPRDGSGTIDGEEIFDDAAGAVARPATWRWTSSALAKLPDGAREIFVLHDVEGYKHHEIADLLEISVGTSKAQLHRARMMLRRHLRPA